MALWKQTDTANGHPVYLDQDEADKAYFVDTTEMGVASNRNKGLKTPGWNLYDTYVDSSGNTRHKVESLVPMRVTAGAAGDVGAIVIDVADMSNGVEYTIVTAGNTDFTALGAANSDVGTTFTANTAEIANTDIIGATAGTVRPTEDDTVADS